MRSTAGRARAGVSRERSSSGVPSSGSCSGMSGHLPMYTALPGYPSVCWTRSRVFSRGLGHHGRVRRVRETALCAFVAALVVVPGAVADVAPAPCVGAGLVAIVPPGATEPTTLGPAITAATTTGADAATFHDAQYSADLTDAQAGGAGCVHSTAPGGTHSVSHRWSVLGAVSGGSLRADLVPATGDGTGWHLRTTINALRVGTRTVDAVAGTTTPVSNWGTLTIDAQADLPTLAPLRYWAAALEVKLTRAHAGLAAGTLVLIGYAAANHAPAKPPPPPPPPTTTTATTATTTRASTTTAPVT